MRRLSSSKRRRLATTALSFILGPGFWATDLIIESAAGCPPSRGTAVARHCDQPIKQASDVTDQARRQARIDEQPHAELLSFLQFLRQLLDSPGETIRVQDQTFTREQIGAVLATNREKFQKLTSRPPVSHMHPLSSTQRASRSSNLDLATRARHAERLVNELESHLPPQE